MVSNKELLVLFNNQWEKQSLESPLRFPIGIPVLDSWKEVKWLLYLVRQNSIFSGNKTDTFKSIE